MFKGNDDDDSTTVPDGGAGSSSSTTSPPSSSSNTSRPNVKFTLADDQPILCPSIREEDEKGEVILRPPRDTAARSPLMNKRLRNVQSVPYFAFRPASENDIFSITGGAGGGGAGIGGGSGQFSMTPEIPSISYSTLPKNYEDTPAIEKYKESVSLYSIQTANSAKINEMDFSMPRYFRKADIIAHSADNLRPLSSLAMGGSLTDSMSSSGKLSGSGGGSTKNLEKSKRLKLLRTNLPPLSIHLGGSSRDRASKGIE